MPKPNIEISQYSGADYEYAYIQASKLDEQAIACYCRSLQRRLINIPLTIEQSEIWIVDSGPHLVRFHNSGAPYLDFEMWAFAREREPTSGRALKAAA